MDEQPVTTSPGQPSGLARSIFSSPLVRIPALGFVLLMMMGLNSDVMTIYAGEPVKSV